jgi:replication factor C large subunit
MFVDKYRPSKLSEVVGQVDSLRKVASWFKNWKPGKALLLHGPAGVGKTSSIESLAAENDYDFIEMNASDYRTAKQIKEVLGRSAQQSSLFKQGKIFMIDEVDGLAGREDRGGVGEIIKIIKNSRHPIVLTANDVWDRKLRSLRRHCTLVEFGKLATDDMENRLRQICKSENLKCDNAVLHKIVKNAEGDLRSAINDLETVSIGKKKITVEDLKILPKRERDKTIYDALKTIFKSEDTLTAKMSLNGLDMPPEDVMWWIENNIANEYVDAEEIASAYDALSKADIFKAWIRKTGNWRFRAYMVDMMTAGVSAAKKNVYRKFTRYGYPRNIIVLGRSKGKRATAKKLFAKISKHLHCSTSTFRRDYLPFLRIMMKSKDIRKEIKESFEIDSEDMKLIS